MNNMELKVNVLNHKVNVLNHKVNILEHEIIAHKSACKIYFENEKESFELYIADLGETTEFDFELGKTVVTGHEYSLVLTFLDRVVLYNEESEYIEEYFMFTSIEELAAEAVDIIKSYNAIDFSLYFQGREVAQEKLLRKIKAKNLSQREIGMRFGKTTLKILNQEIKFLKLGL